jgi:alpha-1,2-mannosyltransferase
MVSHRFLRRDGAGTDQALSLWLGSRRADRLLIALVALASCGAALAQALADATRHQIDFDIYRMGAAVIRTRHAYSARLPSALMGGGRGLHFTYPPFAALLFWPFAHLSVSAGQFAWSTASVVALMVLTAVSLRMVRPDWPAGLLWCLAAVALFPVLRLEPDSLNLAYGQINIFIVLLVVLDFSGEARWKTHRLPRGILIGLAAAIKLTPLLFIPFLFLTRQVRAGLTALALFLACTLAALVIAPSSSWRYWSADIFDAKRSGNLLYISNQDLHSGLQRIVGSPPPAALFVPLAAAVAVGGLAVATWAYRASSMMAGILVCAATDLILSPVSWAHHYIWIVPALAWLALGPDRPAGGWLWALATAVLFWVAPIWLVADPQSGYGGPLTLLEGNSFVLAAAALPVVVGAMLWLRGRSARQRGPVGSGSHEIAYSNRSWLLQSLDSLTSARGQRPGSACSSDGIAAGPGSGGRQAGGMQPTR